MQHKLPLLSEHVLPFLLLAANLSYAPCLVWCIAENISNLDPSVLAFSLSLHRRPYLFVLFSIL